MDIKRLLMALVLSFVFIITWNVFFPPPLVNNADYEDQKDVKSALENKKDKLSSNQKIKNKLSFSDKISKSIETSLLNLDLVNGASSIASCKVVESENGSLKHVGAWGDNGEIYYDDVPVELMRSARCNPCIKINGEYVSFDNFNYTQSEKGSHTILSYSESGLNKETVIFEDSYVVDHHFNNIPKNAEVSIVWDAGILPSERMLSDDISYFSVFAQDQDSYSEEFLSSVEVGSSLVFDDRVGWAGIKSKYFMNAITNQKFDERKADKVVFRAVEKNINDLKFTNAEVEFFYRYDDLVFNESGQKVLSLSSYMGPIDTDLLENNSKTQHLVQLFGFGWFFIGYLGKGIMWLLTSLHKIVPNYGIICIMFAFLIRLLTGPLTKKSFLSNQKMQAVQPKMKKIQDKYKDNPTQLNQEIMSLYKKEGVNPLGGCLPILVQMPLLIALFQVFRKTIEFRGAPFLPFWITDLSQPDVILNVPFLSNIWGLSYFFGHGIALLPILMGVVMFMNMKMTATSNMNPQATSTMYIMNGFFVLLFNTFPSGLNLYYTVYNILNFIQQRKLQKV